MNNENIIIAHMADLHLRDTQYASSSRGADFYEAAMQAVIAVCDTPNLAFIVCCGDNFDMARPSAKVIGQLMSIDRYLRSRNVAMLAITGNHDYTNPTWLDTLFPGAAENVARGGIIPLDGKVLELRGLRVAGVPPYTAAAFRDKILDTRKLVEGADVVLYHGFVRGITDVFTQANVLDVSELPVMPGHKAWLLGDIHRQHYIKVPAYGTDCLVGYPGSTEACNTTETFDKSVPLIGIPATGCAEVVGSVPVVNRPFVAAEVRTEEEVDALMARVEEVADRNPVVIVDFDRNLTQLVKRLHTRLDAQRSVIRCYPLPGGITTAVRTEMVDGEAPLDLAHFVRIRFAERPDLETVAVAMVDRGESDAVGIITDFIEERKAASTSKLRL